MRVSLAILLRSVGYEIALFKTADSFLADDTAESGCILLDMRMPGISGVPALTRMLVAHPSLPVIVMTGHADVTLAIDAMRAGAVNLLQKPFREQALLDAVQEALDRGTSGQRRQVETSAAHAAYGTLTPTERKVMAGVAAGLLNKQIAAEINRSEQMVKLHRARVLEKMGVRRGAQLARLAERLDLAETGASEHCRLRRDV